MRILLLSTYFSPDAAANGVLMANLAEDLRGMGHEITVITTMPHYSENRIWEGYRGKLWRKEHKNGVDVYRLYFYVPTDKMRLESRALSYATWNLSSLLCGILIRKHDLLFVPSPPLTCGLSAFLISRSRGIPFIYGVQDIFPDVAIRLGVLRGMQTIKTFKALEKFVYKKASAVSVISDSFKLNLLSKGVPESKVHVIPNFVDANFIQPLPRRNRFGTEIGLDAGLSGYYSNRISWLGSALVLVNSSLWISSSFNGV